MAKGSKRVAARQASLSKKRKKVGLKPAVVHQPPPPRMAARGPSVAEPERDEPGEQQLPELRATGEAIARLPNRPQTPAQAASVPARRALPQSPHFRTDLKLIGMLALGMLVILVVLDLIIS